MTAKIEKVLLLDGVDSVCGEILQKAGIKVTVHAKLSKEQLAEELKSHDGMVVRSATKVTSDVLAAAPALKIVGRAGTGVDNIDVEAATRRGVIVMNTPGGNTLSAAEHTCAMVCSLSRSVPQACAALKAGKWDRKSYMGSELYGKTLAIVGLGRIGREVAKRMQSFGMTTIGYDPMIPAHVTAEWGVESMSLEELWPRADYITVHTPLLPHTRNLIGSEVLSKCKRGVRIVNVFLEEPPTDLTLCQHPKVICTPHLGANTKEAQRRVACEIAQQMVDMMQGKPLVGVINAPALTNATSDACRPWIELAQSLGCLANRISQPTDTPSLSISLHLYGAGVSKMKTFLGSAVLVGLLKEMASSDVNLVNAPLMAQEMGVTVTVDDHPDICPSIAAAGPEAVEVKVTRGLNTHTLLGNVSGGQATLYGLDGCVWEAGLTLGRNMLFFTASPGTSPLAAIATQLASLQASLTSLSSSVPNTKEGWHVARTQAAVDFQSAIPNARLVAQVSF